MFIGILVYDVCTCSDLRKKITIIITEKQRIK